MVRQKSRFHKRRWLIFGCLADIFPLMLIFKDEFHEGFGPFFLVGFLLVGLPLFFGLGALIGYYFDKYFNPKTSKSFYKKYIIISGFFTLILLWLFYPRTVSNPDFGYIIKIIFFDVYHLPLYIAIIILGLSVSRVYKKNA